MSTAVGGLLAVLAASVLFGTTGTAQALGSQWAGVDLDPLTVGATRVVAAAAVLAVICLARGGLGFSRTSLRLPILGGVGVAVYQIGFFSGVQQAGVAAGTMIALGSGPAFTGAVQWIVERRRPGWIWFLSTALAVIGMALIVLGSDASAASDLASGALYALAAGFGYAMYTVAGSRLIRTGVRPDAAMAQMFAVGALILLPVLAATWPGGLNTVAGLSVSIYLALVPTVLAYILFAIGLRSLPPATVATLTLAEPVVATVFGVVLLGETLSGPAILGMAVVVSALTLLAAAAARGQGRASVRRSTTADLPDG